MTSYRRNADSVLSGRVHMSALGRSCKRSMRTGNCVLLIHLTIWTAVLLTVIIPPCTKSVICCLDSFFHSVLNKSSCLNYLLPEQRSDVLMDKLRHPSIFRLPRVRTTRLKSFLLTLLLCQPLRLILL